ncbi:MAG: ABC transporter ATP-binding protein [Gemmatimonadetes bacterium]|jgi:ABC-2 type transport system ATP-binding protein|nr:ABC transporter ATP-binding protein [Gemmatimonadota bacterium]MBT6148624.1 ABC transporter ATP-binding protein [Gemmatimonadota bacterium]MBT7861383.1 ABC transporter ATP-binding protein [Gemmatimonadota bacterium]
MSTVEITGLSKRYRRTHALRGVDLRCETGRVVGILGENGSGKSTLFRILAGITRPTAGDVLIDGMPVGVETRRVTAYVPEIDAFYDWMLVDEQLDFLASFYGRWDHAKARELTQFMGLDGQAQIGEMSKGQRARLKFVAAFAWPSDLVLLDEPLGGIDPPSRTRILKAMVQEFRDKEQTILISTHLVAEIEEVVDEVVFFHDGEIALQGNADTLRTDRGGSLSQMFEEVLS